MLCQLLYPRRPTQDHCQKVNFSQPLSMVYLYHFEANPYQTCQWDLNITPFCNFLQITSHNPYVMHDCVSFSINGK